MESSIQGKMIRELIAHFSSDLLIGKKIKNGDLRKKLVNVEPRWRCPEGFSWTEIQMKDFTMDWLVPEENNREKVVLQLHGGGYIPSLAEISVCLRRITVSRRSIRFRRR